VSQMTYDGKLLFPVAMDAKEVCKYTIVPSDTAMIYSQVSAGRQYPERADDIAWENDIVGFRAYGPATQAKGEKAYGYDIFFKYPSAEPVLECLYAPETSPRTWEIVDSLRKIDEALAQEFIHSFSYHVDHGLGMDCYAVGPTLGAGVAAVMQSDTIAYPWCYETAEVMDNGPLRFTVRMTFAPESTGDASTLTEQRLITLDAGSHLNKCKVWYDGQNEPLAVVAGFPRRDNSDAQIYMDENSGVIAYADPTQGTDNGKALLGIVVPLQPDSVFEKCGHILTGSTLEPTDTLTYYWGFAWDRTDISDMNEWDEYLKKYAQQVKSPLKVAIDY
ncbi:MAG: DUF4861 domain-containing protein, partial [Muribaculaceae bacterium]|nr:DUF4861 domain-containing protein [Muribaculaceae bacterium]